MNDSADALRIAAAVRDLLPPTVRPWSIEVDIEPVLGGWEVSLQHEASFGLVYMTGENDAMEAIAHVRQLMASNREFARIAAAPLLVNLDDVMEVRSLAHIFNWTQLEVRSVVALIRRWTLTEDEAEWLSSYIGRDGPTPTPSWDF